MPLVFLDGDDPEQLAWATRHYASTKAKLCLLYTSDAADERSSVDLGGRRIIKPKTTHHTTLVTTAQSTASH